jgi:hypothetical protein
MQLRRTILALPLGALIALGCDSGAPAPDAAKKPAEPPNAVQTPGKKGKPARRPVGESKNIPLSPSDD